MHGLGRESGVARAPTTVVPPARPGVCREPMRCGMGMTRCGGWRRPGSGAEERRVVHAKPVYHPGVRRQVRRAVSVPLAFARCGLLRPGNPVRIFRQLALLGSWGTSLAGLLMSSAAREPGRTALVDDEGPMTFAELDARSDRLAMGLAPERVGPRPRVGVLCRNHRGMVQTLVASSKRGAEVVLLNTGLGKAQLGAVLSEL